MSRRTLILYIVLLFVPTLIVGVAAYSLLWHEKDRLNNALRARSILQAQDLARDLTTSFEAVQHDILLGLSRIPGASLSTALSQIRIQNPLVRHAFSWHPVDGVSFSSANAFTKEPQERVARRYRDLLTGPLPWTERQPAPIPARVAGMGLVGDLTLSPPIPNPNYTMVAAGGDVRPNAMAPLIHPVINKKYRQRSELRRLARMEVRDSVKAVDASGSESGWITWDWEDTLYLLGWYQPASGDIVRGVELDIDEVMNRLLPGVFAGLPEGMIFCLRNESDEIVFQEPAARAPSGEALIRMHLGEILPNWYVSVHVLHTGVGEVPGQTLVLMSAVLLTFFIAAILLGGLALIRQAYQGRRDAVQKTTFVSSVTHELRTPLTSIRMYVDLLRAGAVEHPEKRDRYLGIISSESRRLARLVNNVLSFGRLERGMESYTIESLDLGPCMERILDKQRPRLEESGVRLIDSFNAASTPVRVDRDAFEQVVLNLIDNATKYAGNGSGTEIEFEMRQSVEGVELRVMDRGAGIPEEHQDRIFEQFQRVESSLSDGQKGTGLGLSISRRLMRDIGGDLYYESRAGGGSVFVVKLPTEDKAGQ